MGLVKSLCQGRQDDQRLDYLEGMGESFRRLSRHANANRVTIYTIQALGLRSHLTATSATERGVVRTQQALTRYNSESKTQQRLGMSYLADETGGRARTSITRSRKSKRLAARRAASETCCSSTSLP